MTNFTFILSSKLKSLLNPFDPVLVDKLPKVCGLDPKSTLCVPTEDNVISLSVPILVSTPFCS